MLLLRIAATPSVAQHHALPDSLQLDEVVIKGIYEKQKSNILNPTDKVLEGTAGISMIRRGNFAMEPTIRGLSNGQINVTIDGMRIFGACTDRMDPVSSYIEPNNLGSISVDESPGDNQFGTSVGGGINFRLKEPEFSVKTQLRSSFGSGFETNANAFQGYGGVTFSGQNAALQADGIYRRSSNYSAGKGGEILYSQYQKWNGHLAGKIRVSKSSFLKADYLQDEGYNIGYPALPMDVAFAKAKIASVSYVDKNLESDAVWETKAYFNFIDHAMDDTRRPKSMVPIHMDMPGTSRTYGFYSSFSKTWMKRHHLQTRVDGFNNELSATMTMYPDSGPEMFMFTLPHLGRTGAGISVTDHIAKTQKLLLRAGVRFEWLYDYQFSKAGKEQLSGFYEGDLSRNRVILNLNAGLDYQVNEQSRLSLDLSRGGRSATLQESYGFYIFNRADGFDYIGNPNLKQETSVNVNLSYEYRSPLVTVKLKPFLYAFQNYIVGSILPDYSIMTIGANGVKRYTNISGATLSGVTLHVDIKPFGNFKLSSNTTYTQGKDAHNNWLPMIAPLRAVNTLSYVFKEYFFSSELIHNATQRKISSRIYGESRTPASTILNLNIGKTFRWQEQNQIRISASADNLFDVKYFQHMDVMKVPRQGRNFILRTSFSF
jgi:iron complex outermembrane receptor protein